MAVTEELSYRICETDAEGTPYKVIARAEHFDVAAAAYEQALKSHSRVPISLLQKARQIRHKIHALFKNGFCEAHLSATLVTYHS